MGYARKCCPAEANVKGSARHVRPHRSPSVAPQRARHRSIRCCPSRRTHGLRPPCLGRRQEDRQLSGRRAERRLRLQRAPDRRLCRRGRRRAPRLQARRQASERGRRHAGHHEALEADRPGRARQEGHLRRRRHPDQPGRGPHRRPPDDRARQGDHVQRLLVLGGGGRPAVSRPGDGRHLHGRRSATPTTPPARTAGATASATSSTPI